MRATPSPQVPGGLIRTSHRTGSCRGSGGLRGMSAWLFLLAFRYGRDSRADSRTPDRARLASTNRSETILRGSRPTAWWDVTHCWEHHALLTPRPGRWKRPIVDGMRVVPSHSTVPGGSGATAVSLSTMRVRGKWSGSDRRHQRDHGETRGRSDPLDRLARARQGRTGERGSWTHSRFIGG